MIKRKLILFFANRKDIPWQQDEIRVYGKIHHNRLTACLETKENPILFEYYDANRILNLLCKKQKNGNREGFAGYHFTTVLPNQYRDGKTATAGTPITKRIAGTNLDCLLSFAERTFQLKHNYKRPKKISFYNTEVCC
jgi:hypothetical protein